MTLTLSDLGLREIIRDSLNEQSASLYVQGGPIVAFLIRRQPSVSKEYVINSKIWEKEHTPGLTNEQYSAIERWYQYQYDAAKTHFAEISKFPSFTSGSFLTFV